MSDFESVLESGFQEATNRESFARQIEAKIKEIEGAEDLLFRYCKLPIAFLLPLTSYPCDLVMGDPTLIKPLH